MHPHNGFARSEKDEQLEIYQIEKSSLTQVSTGTISNYLQLFLNVKLTHSIRVEFVRTKKTKN